MKVYGFGGKLSKGLYKVVNVTIDSERVFQLIASDSLCVIDSDYLVRNRHILARNELRSCPTASSDEISVIIGADLYYKVVTGVIKRLDDDLVAVETVYGWTLHGISDTSGEVSVNLCQTCDIGIKKFWDLELSGIVPGGNIENAASCEVAID